MDGLTVFHFTFYRTKYGYQIQYWYWQFERSKSSKVGRLGCVLVRDVLINKILFSFWTDSSGRDWIERVKDIRPSISNFNNTALEYSSNGNTASRWPNRGAVISVASSWIPNLDRIAGNYYPITNRVRIQDSKKFLSQFSQIALTAEHRSKKATWNWWFREEFEILWKLDQFLSVVNSKQGTGKHESNKGFG